MIGRYFTYALISLVLVVVQTKLMRLLTVEGITPDILTIWVVFLALREGQLPASVWGFCIGLLFDLATGNFIGLSALSKTICGFFAGYFYSETKMLQTLASYRFLMVVLFASVIQNTVYFIIYAQGSEIGFLRAIFQVGLATAFYTTTWTLLPMFAFTRRSMR
ncbi:MAG TPA: rod shape-determining protein MreD [Bacteroidota bacterium]|nr:rod shape-determining protein MreD [Bacteroidota bacterium]